MTIRKLTGSQHGQITLWTSSSSGEYICEDWPGEAALVEVEMRRFKKWAERKVRSLVGDYAGREEHYRLVTWRGQYLVIHESQGPLRGEKRVWP